MPRKPKHSSRLSEAPAATEKRERDDLLVVPAPPEDEGAGEGVEVHTTEGTQSGDPGLQDGVVDASVFDELYAGEPKPRYAVDTDGSERYAKKRSGDDYYITDGDGKPILAKKRLQSGETQSFLATDGAGRPMETEYSFDDAGRPVLQVDANGNQTYLVVNGDEIYPFDPVTGDEFYATDLSGKRRFARKSSGREYYAARKDGVSGDKVEHAPGRLVFDAATGTHPYPMNLRTKTPVFDIGPDGNDVYFYDGSMGDVCATGPTGDVVYRRDAVGKEVLPRNTDGTSRYCRDADGDETYPKEGDGRTQYYMFDAASLKEIGARKAGIGFYYARDFTGGEKYPRLFGLASDAKQQPFGSDAKASAGHPRDAGGKADDR